MSRYIEMSGLEISAIVTYGIDENGKLVLNKRVVFPLLRTLPESTCTNLVRDADVDVLNVVNVGCVGYPEFYSMPLKAADAKVDKISFDGVLRAEGTVSGGRLHTSGDIEEYVKLKIIREIAPSPDKPMLCEEFQIQNIGKKKAYVEIPDLRLNVTTPKQSGVYGSYEISAATDKSGTFYLDIGESVKFTYYYTARRLDKSASSPDSEIQKRRQFLEKLKQSLILETPDKIVNTMFSFAKVRTSEAVFSTAGGLMHSPCGMAYYAAIWANDQGEYASPFFSFLDCPTAYEAALNTYRQYSRFINDKGKALPASIICEGREDYTCAGDRGDSAMVGYGAARFALTCGNEKLAREIFPLVKWCAEFCNSKLSRDGVVMSDSDEMENRFESGNTNLSCSCLYYDMLVSLSHLSRDLKIGNPQIYEDRAVQLRKNIEKFFGAKIEGFNTYRYCEESDKLRSWLGIPLCVGIFDRADETAKALLSEKITTPNGMLVKSGTKTFWDRSALYAMRGIFYAGYADKAAKFMSNYSKRRLLGNHVPYPIEAWPEGNQRHLAAEGSLYCRIFTEGMFGIRPTGLKKFTIKPSLPSEWKSASLKRIKAFGKDFDINLSDKDGYTNVCIVSNKTNASFEKKVEKGGFAEISLPDNF